MHRLQHPLPRQARRWAQYDRKKNDWRKNLTHLCKDKLVSGVHSAELRGAFELDRGYLLDYCKWGLIGILEREKHHFSLILDDESSARRLSNVAIHRDEGLLRARVED